MVHCFKRADILLALDVGSGAVHILSQPAYALLSDATQEIFAKDNLAEEKLQNMQKLGFTLEEANDAFDQIKELISQDLLFADDSYSEFKDQLGASPVKAMCLHVAHDCNLRCRYCFAATGDFGGNRELMSLDVAKKAIDMLIEQSGKRRNLEVDFFGGEPLMNFEVVKQTVAYARSKEKDAGKCFRFTVTTNGLGLNDERIEYINKEMGNVVLSLDGRKDINDYMRPTVSGNGSYDVIVPQYQKLVKNRGDKEYYVRGTYTRENTDFDADVLLMHQLGFDQISVEPVIGPETEDYTIRDIDIPAVEAAYENLMYQLIERRTKRKDNFNFFHFMLDLENGPCAIKRLKGCGSGNEYLAVTPSGDLYPCHQFVGQTEFLMGSVDDGVTRKDLKEKFADAHLLNKSECLDCWAKLFCSGGCNANNHSFGGSILKPYELSCQLEKIRLECSIAIQAALAISD